MSELARYTIFALLSGIERDLRLFLASALAFDSLPLSEDEETQASQRLKADKSSIQSATAWQDLLDYLDLSQILDVASRHDLALASSLRVARKDVQDEIKKVRALVQIRNRVCHFRPLEVGDLTSSIDITESLTNGKSPLQWNYLGEVRTQLAGDFLKIKSPDATQDPWTAAVYS
jgi:hypothetical protein